LANIADITKKEDYEANKRIFEEKSIANNLYLVDNGSVAIRMKGEVGNGRLLIDTVKKGEIFGWSSVAEPHTFTAAAHTLEKTTVYVISSHVLLDLFKKNNHIGYKVMSGIASVISSRFRQLCLQFANLM